MLFSPSRRPRRATQNDHPGDLPELDVGMSGFWGRFRHLPWDGLAPTVNMGILTVRSITQHRTSPHALMLRIWPVSQREYAKTSVHLWHIPPRSPDLNPVERFWAYLRKRLRAMDMKDLKDKKPPVGKAELKRRVRMVVQTKKAKETCKRMLRSLVKTAQIVIKKKGAASGL